MTQEVGGWILPRFLGESYTLNPPFLPDFPLAGAAVAGVTGTIA